MELSRMKKQELAQYVTKLKSIGYELGDDAYIVIKGPETVHACYFNVAEPKIFDITGSANAVKAAMVALDTYGAAIVSKPEFACKFAYKGESIPAVLDDMAQIVGSEVSYVPSDRFNLKKGLKGCSAVITDRGELITCGRTLYEAFTCLTITEKNAEIVSKSEVLGGAKAINKYFGQAEHAFYLRKYSKAENNAQKEKMSGLAALNEAASEADRRKHGSDVADKKHKFLSGISTVLSKAETAAANRIAKSANEGTIGRIIDKMDERGEDSKLAQAANRIGEKLGRPDVNANSSYMYEQPPIEAPAALQDRFWKPMETPREQLDQFKEQFNPYRLSESELEIADVLVQYGRKLLAADLVQGTWGNLSMRLDDTYMICTPSGLDYERLTPQDMVKVNYHTHEYDSIIKPTSEKNLHAGIYRSRDDVNAIIHTHSKYCSIFAACDTTMEASNNTVVKCAKYGIAGTEALAQSTFKALGKNKACFMSHHGMVAVGSSIEDAFKTCAVIELTAKEYINSNYEG